MLHRFFLKHSDNLIENNFLDPMITYLVYFLYDHCINLKCYSILSFTIKRQKNILIIIIETFENLVLNLLFHIQFRVTALHYIHFVMLLHYICHRMPPNYYISMSPNKYQMYQVHVSTELTFLCVTHE